MGDALGEDETLKLKSAEENKTTGWASDLSKVTLMVTDTPGWEVWNHHKQI